MKSFTERRPWLVGLISVLLISLGLYLAFSVNRFKSLKGVYEISAELEDAAGLQSGNEVRVAGVKVGQVTGVELATDSAIVVMEIQDDVRIPSETELDVKLKTILGQKFVDLQMPQAFLARATLSGDPTSATNHFLSDGDVIPLSQTSIPYEIYQAATEGTRAIEEINKEALRNLVSTLAETLNVSGKELGEALESVDEASAVLKTKNAGIRKLLVNASDLSGTLAESGDNIEGLLERATEVLGTLADNRRTTSSLLAATNDLTENLGLLIQAARGSIQVGTGDLNGILTRVDSELDTLDEALAEFGVAQELFGQNIKFGRFIEGHACSFTTANLCRPDGSPVDPKLPQEGSQPGQDSAERRTE
jgi:phospholipid/cholesterol/gamma-HCH transport system substrate-binding protein